LTTKCTEAEERRAVRILKRLAASMDATRLARQIDEPIDGATRAFACSCESGISHRRFLDILTAFLQHLYASAFPNGRQPTQTEARDEAMALLEQASPAGGYHESLLAAAESLDDGLGEVLLRVAELIKSRQRSARLRWIAASHLDCLDWRTKCQIAAILLRRCRPYLSGRVAACRPEQMADYIPDLLAIDLAIGR